MANIKRDEFITMVENLLMKDRQVSGDSLSIASRFGGGLEFFEAFKKAGSGAVAADKPVLTDNGKIILKALQEMSVEGSSMFTSKAIADHAFISSRSVSGAIKKLVTDGFATKEGDNPCIYSITDKGREFDIDVV